MYARAASRHAGAETGVEVNRKERQGIGAIFWATFILFGLRVLMGLFYWMVHKQSPRPNAPKKNGALWIAPVAAAPGAMTCRLKYTRQ